MTISHSFKQFAKCKIIKDPNFFFPEDLPGTKTAIAFCQDCLVKTPCTLYAIENNINHGVWGGLSIRSRAKLKREQKLL